MLFFQNFIYYSIISIIVLLISFFSVSLLLIIINILKSKHERKPLHTSIVLGSGGHTTEMFKMLSTLDLKKFSNRTYYIAETDYGSLDKVKEFESKVNNTKYTIIRIPRSRHVGQSYISSIFTTLYSIFSTFNTTFKKCDVLLTNGPGTCVPIVIWTWLHKFFFNYQCSIILLESYACVKHHSLTAKLIYPFVDHYYVQWSYLLNKRVGIFKPSKVYYTGRLPLENETQHENIELNFKSYVLVTVGSTKFDALISAINNPSFINILKKFGYSGLHVQKGKTNIETNLEMFTSHSFEIKVFDYTNQWDEEVRNCDLIIGHAGAGTILDSLEREKPVIVVANEALMSNHQTEIAQEMEDRGYILSTTTTNLIEHFENIIKDTINLKKFPKQESERFKLKLDELIESKFIHKNN